MVNTNISSIHLPKARALCATIINIWSLCLTFFIYKLRICHLNWNLTRNRKPILWTVILPSAPLESVNYLWALLRAKGWQDLALGISMFSIVLVLIISNATRIGVGFLSNLIVHPVNVSVLVQVPLSHAVGGIKWTFEDTSVIRDTMATFDFAQVPFGIMLDYLPTVNQWYFDNGILEGATYRGQCTLKDFDSVPTLYQIPSSNTSFPPWSDLVQPYWPSDYKDQVLYNSQYENWGFFNATTWLAYYGMSMLTNASHAGYNLTGIQPTIIRNYLYVAAHNVPISLNLNQSTTLVVNASLAACTYVAQRPLTGIQSGVFDGDANDPLDTIYRLYSHDTQRYDVLGLIDPPKPRARDLARMDQAYNALRDTALGWRVYGPLTLNREILRIEDWALVTLGLSLGACLTVWGIYLILLRYSRRACTNIPSSLYDWAAQSVIQLQHGSDRECKPYQFIQANLDVRIDRRNRSASRRIKLVNNSNEKAFAVGSYPTPPSSPVPLLTDSERVHFTPY